jgi:hypothetical protein
MPQFVPRLADARELLLVACVAAALIGLSVIAAGLSIAEHVPARVAVASSVSTPAPRPSIVPLPSWSAPACDCDTTRRAPQSLPVSGDPALISAKSPRPLHAPAHLRSLESSSFHQWLRDEPDPRRILARMSRMSNHAPRSYATEPPK